MRMRRNQFLSIILSLAMVLGLMPGMGLTAYAAGGGTKVTQANVICQQYSYMDAGDYSSGAMYDTPPADITNIELADAQAFGAAVNCPTTYWVVVYAKDGDNLKWTSNGKTGEQTSTPLSVSGRVLSAWCELYNDDVFHFGGNYDPNSDVTFYFSKGLATVSVTGVSLDKTTTQTIDVDGTVSFTATVEPDNATDKTVKWSVGGTNADAVKLYTDENCTTEVGADATDKLTVYAKGISAGSATITATSNANAAQSASCTVTVNEAGHQIGYIDKTGVDTITISGTESASMSDDITVKISYSDDRTHFDHVDVLQRGVQEGGITVGDTDNPVDFAYASTSAQGNLVFNNPNGKANQGLAVTNGDRTLYAWQDVNHRFAPELYIWKCTEFDEDEGVYTFTPFARTTVALKSTDTNDDGVTTVVFEMPDADVDVVVYSIIDKYSRVYFSSDCNVEHDVENGNEFKEDSTVTIHLSFGANDKYESVNVELYGEDAPIYPNEETIYSLSCIEETFADSDHEGWTVVFVSADDTSNVLGECIYNREEYTFTDEFLPSKYVWKCVSMDIATKKVYFATVDKTVTGVVVDDANPKSVTVIFPMPATDVQVSILGDTDFTDVTTWAELQEKLTAGINAKLANDITATETDTALTLPESALVAIDLNGHILNRAQENAALGGSVFDIDSGDTSVYLTICNKTEADTEHPYYVDGDGNYHFVDDETNPEYAAASTKGVIRGSVITGGNTMDNGGAFKLTGRVNLTLWDVTIVGNKAMGNGGAIYAEGADINEYYHDSIDITLLDDVIITGNVSNGIGGIYFVGGENKENSLSLMGTPIVIGNANGNVYLPDGMDTEYDMMNEGAVVGFTMETPGDIMYERETDEEYTEAMRLAQTRARIKSDDPDYYVDIVDNTAKLVKYVTVSFAANEGTGEMHAQKMMRSTATALTRNAFNRNGYTFSGWNTVANGSGTSYTNAQSVSLTGNITLYAQWTRNSTPSYNDGGSSSSSSFSGGGSSSSSSSTTTTITVPVSSDSASVNVSASVSGTTATVKAPTTAELEKVVNTANQTGEVEIDVSGLGRDITAATIPTETVKAVEKAAADTTNDATGLTVTLTDGSVTFDAPALSAITEQAKGSTIQLNFDSISESKMTAAQRGTTQTMDVQAVFDAYVTSNGVRISDFGEGTATVSIPYTLKNGQNQNGIEVWYIANDGSKTKMPSTFDGQKVSFITSHFSNYVIAYNEDLANAVDAVEVFNDVNATDWFTDAVRWAYRNNVMNGVSPRMFTPDGDTSRAMVATMLWRLEGSPVVNYAMDYVDVAADQWYTEAIRWATSTGIITGHKIPADDTPWPMGFEPNKAVTREQLATMLYRYARYKGMDVSIGENTNILSYGDAFDISEYAIPAMQWAVGAGIVNGYTERGEQILAPYRASSRAVVATMLMRYVNGK